jgi:hypothetical protein
MSFFLSELLDEYGLDYNLPYTLMELKWDENIMDYTTCEDDGKVIHFNGTYTTEYGKTGERDIYILLNRIDYKIFKDYTNQVDDFDDRRFLQAIKRNVIIYQNTVEDNFKHIITYNILGGTNRRG